jgi:hypothetical protein
LLLLLLGYGFDAKLQLMHLPKACLRSGRNSLLLFTAMGAVWAHAQTNQHDKGLYEAHVKDLKKRAPAGFTILVERA